MVLRLIKAALVLSLGIYFLIVAFSNIIDFETNFIFVKHVLSMDTTFQSPCLMHRAISNVTLQKIIYELMISIETIIGLSCLLAAFFLGKFFRDPLAFQDSKPFALASLSLGFFYFFGGFIIVGGEWFCMWQSHVANAQQIAGTFSILILLLLLFLNQHEENI